MTSRRLWSPALRLAFVSLVAGTGLAHAQANDALYATGKALFLKATPACAVCHTLQDARAEGAVGPVLDEIKPDAARVAKALRDGLGSMPSYRASLTDEQIAALARYVARASGGAP